MLRRNFLAALLTPFVPVPVALVPEPWLAGTVTRPAWLVRRNGAIVSMYNFEVAPDVFHLPPGEYGDFTLQPGATIIGAGNTPLFKP